MTSSHAEAEKLGFKCPEVARIQVTEGNLVGQMLALNNLVRNSPYTLCIIFNNRQQPTTNTFGP